MLDDALTAAVFRANPQYDLVPLDRLGRDERRDARTTADDRATYGVIRATMPNGAPARCVSADVALLFLTLREAGRLPAYFFRALGSSCRDVLAGLTAEGILEVELDGVYMSGPRGFAALLGAAESPRAWSTDTRSMTALRFALARNASDVREVAARLYAHHRIPANARWRALLACPADVERFLGIQARCAIEFQRMAGWYSWISTLGAASCRYKLYVSPQPDALRETLAAVVGASRYGARALKIGGDLHGLLRPDKLVVYFSTFESLAQAAQRLSQKLADVPAHGVPFTALIGSSGLLSWGIDGFSEDGGSATPMSWRQWLTLRLAATLVIAQRHPPVDEDAVWAFVRQKIAHDGVDVRTWSPLGSLCRSAPVPASVPSRDTR